MPHKIKCSAIGVLDFFIFFHLFLPATYGGGSGGAMDEEIEREKGRFFFFF